MSGRGMLAFAAGLGTGYLNGKKQQEEKARQAKIDARDEAERAERTRIAKKTEERSDAEYARQQAMTEALAKVGQQPEQAPVAAAPAADPMTPTAIDQGDGVTTYPMNESAPDLTAQPLPPNPAAAGITAPKPFSRAEILKQTADALKLGGVDSQLKAVELMGKADDERVKELQLTIANAQTPEDIIQFHKTVKDGYQQNFETDPATGKLVAYMTDEKTGKSRLTGTYDNFEQYKQFAMTQVSNDPASAIAFMDKRDKQKSDQARAALDEKKLDNQLTIATNREDRADERLNRTLASREGIAEDRLNVTGSKGGKGGGKDWNKEMLPVIKEVKEAVLSYPNMSKINEDGKPEPTKEGRAAQAFAERIMKANPDFSTSNIAEIAHEAATNPKATGFKQFRQPDGTIIQVPAISFKGQLYEYSNAANSVIKPKQNKSMRDDVDSKLDQIKSDSEVDTRIENLKKESIKNSNFEKGSSISRRLGGEISPISNAQRGLTKTTLSEEEAKSMGYIQK